MSNAIRFLETMGQDANLRHAAQGVIASELAQAKIDAPTQAAILGRDHARLEAAVGATAVICCAQDPGHDDDEEIVAQSARRVTAEAA